MTEGRFATLSFERRLQAPATTLWQAWTAPAARAIWSAPSPDVTVEYLEADSRIGGREVSVRRAADQPDIRCEAGWLVLQPPRHSINHELVSCGGEILSAALVTAEIAGEDAAEGEASRLRVTVQISSPARDIETGYRLGFDAGLDNLVALTGRMLVIERLIRAPAAAVWGAWMTPAALPQWWGPDGFSCRTRRMDLREGGEWVFDMIGPDGTIYPNRHRYRVVRPQHYIAYDLGHGVDGTLLANAWATFTPEGDATRVTLGMAMTTAEECARARSFGAQELGLQTLGKLARHVGAA